MPQVHGRVFRCRLTLVFSSVKHRRYVDVGSTVISFHTNTFFFSFPLEF